MLSETPDRGYGGAALCIGTVRPTSNPGDPVVFSATLHGHAGAGMQMESVLSIHEFDPPDFEAGSSYVLSATSTHPALYGVCGLGLGDFWTDDAADVVPVELVVTTLNGDLVVFDLDRDSSGEIVLQGAVHYGLVDGVIGAHNALVVDDLDGDPANGAELYVGTSRGVRRFLPVSQNP